MTDRELAVTAWESLFRAQVGVIRVLASEFPTRTMSLNEYDVLFNLSLQPEHRARLRDINQLVLLSQPSVSRLIDRLVARGFVSKHPDPTDKRGTIVAITDAGFDQYRDVARLHMGTITDLMGSALNDDELRQLAHLTAKLRRSNPEPPPIPLED
jgi:DNA-binding MarR family transcriptional regulator